MTLKAKLTNFPKITNKDHKKLYELADILSEIESVKQDERYGTLLAYFDSSLGILPVINKFPYGIQEKWTSHAVRYKRQHSVAFPPFSVFVEFIRDISKIKNDPCFLYDSSQQEKTNKMTPRTYSSNKQFISTKKTDIVSDVNNNNSDKTCPLHTSSSHTLDKCKAFKGKPISERRKILKETGTCFRCCSTNTHMKKECKVKIKCLDCDSDYHPTALHIMNFIPHANSEAHGGETENNSSQTDQKVKSMCTQICAEKQFSGKSCAKYFLVNLFMKNNPHNLIKAYAILDDQSNKSLAKSELFDRLNARAESREYTLSSCTGTVVTSGRRLTGCIVQSHDGQVTLELPELTECNYILDSRDEIPTPEVAYYHDHLRDLSSSIPPLNDEVPILLLIGRDLIAAHHVHEHRIASSKSPYAQRLSLGWVIIGETCLGKVHPTEHVNVNKTYILRNNRPSIFPPCSSEFDVKDTLSKQENLENILNGDEHESRTIFTRTENDNKPGLSIEDKQFLQIMEKEFQKDSHGNWISPLPFRQTRQRLPNNRDQAMKRAKSLHSSLLKDKVKSEHFVDFMQNILDNGHAEVAPSLSNAEECWYLPIFGVYHPRKPNKIRVVFDSSAKHEGVCLNDVLLAGPDLTNSLLGILLRFQKEPVAITADIEQMFYCFKVREEHRNFLRFLWYRNNDPKQYLIEYRMCVHVFGNKPSPAVATYGLIKTATLSVDRFGQDVVDYVENNFYVDDGLISLSSDTQAIDLMKRTQEALRVKGNLRLHKITSNSNEVMKAFPSEDLAKDVKDLSPDADIPLQRSLGISRNIKSDVFTYQLSSGDKPYTRRGLLSTINSLYDPIGFAAPVVLQGKLFLRNLLKGTINWDDPLPVESQKDWETWKESLTLLSHIHIPRPYTTSSLKTSVSRELHIFSDASEQAIAGVVYLKTIFDDKPSELSFVLGKAKVAPQGGHTIPRLELCGAVLATELYQTISEQLDIEVDKVRFYTDSKIVLGYIHNETRRFYNYVSNRVERIRRISNPNQWTYVSTESNPADYATRIAPVSQLQDSPWLAGPVHILKQESKLINDDYPLEDGDSDKELRPLVTSLKSTINSDSNLESKRFEKYSSWKRLIESISHLRHIASSFRKGNTCYGWHSCSDHRTVESYEQSQMFIIKLVQKEVYFKEKQCIEKGLAIPKGSPIVSLNPYIDDDGIMRVGGRLKRSNISSSEKHPIIIPGKNHIAILLVRHYHQLVAHQGRHITEGAVRSAGYWVTGGKRLISKVIFECVRCRKLRGHLQCQQMSDLPCNRLSPAPPFTFVGVDTFGPWSVVARRTRGGLSHCKRWAILFTCLTIRAIHIEVIEDMSSSAFINALRRFIAIRGNIKEIRSDRGTNFVGATDDLGIHVVNVEDKPIKDFLYDKGTTWIFNPPHSSHFGGVWERMIGTARILDSLLTETGTKHLTGDVISTLMAEVSAIVNRRPIVNVSNDPDFPEILSPSTLLTGKNELSDNTFSQLDFKDMYKAQWKLAQSLAETFWNRWRIEYLQTLQIRRKWENKKPNLSEGDVVLLRDKSVCRNEWPIGIIVKTFPSHDGKVRKLEVRISRDGKTSTYVRPISELVLLHSKDAIV